MSRGKKELSEELELLREAAILEEGKPLRLFPAAMESENSRALLFFRQNPSCSC